MDPINYLLTHLSSLDPPITVLAPEDALKPGLYGPLDSSGRPIAGQQGLSYWLAAHPTGYVQLYEPTPIFSDGLLDTELYVIDAIAPTRGVVRNLAARVRSALGDPIRDGSGWQHFDTQAIPLERDCYRVQMRFQWVQAFQFN